MRQITFTFTCIILCTATLPVVTGQDLRPAGRLPTVNTNVPATEPTETAAPSETETSQAPAAAAETETAPTPAAAATPTPPPPAPTPPPAAPKPQESVGVIDFQGTPLQAVLEYYATRLVNRSLIPAPNLAGVITFRSQTDLTKEEARQALDSVLAINGIAVIPLGEKFLKVVQINTAKQEGLPFAGESKMLPPADTLITQVIPIRYGEPQEVVGALQPYLHPYGQLMPLPKSGCILITETAANVNQMLEIVKYIDQPSALRMETRVFLLTHAKAGDVVARLQAIIQETLQLGARTAAPAPTPQPTPIPGRPVARPAATTAVAGAEDLVVEGKVIITPDERTNKIFIFSRPSNFPFFERIISELDSKVEPDVVVKVITLDYADAVDVASLVNSLITGGSPTTTSTRRRSTGSTTGSRTTPVPAPPAAIPAAAGGGASEAGFLDFAEGVRILPDQRTNSLLVMATKEDLARIEAMVRSVDTAVAQVLIEVVIAEVKLDGQLDVGVEAFKRAFGNDPTSIGGYRTGQPNSPFEVLRDASTNLTALALSSGLTYFTTFSHLKLDAVIRVLATSSKFKVLSTPIIQTLHNQEANIVVGESRPVPVSTVSSVVGGTGTLTTGQLNSNIEFKDIAIELTVTPRINPNGYVTMDIQQKVNDVGGSVPFNGTEVPIITKREAKSSVAVRDGNTIVLGGMIQENKTVTETKVPLLGDIPLFGTLFKGKSNKKSRTELIVFIKPTVLRSDPQAAAEALRRARLLKAGQDLELEKRLESPVPEVPANELYKGLSSAPRSIPSEFDRQTAKARALERAPVKTN